MIESGYTGSDASGRVWGVASRAIVALDGEEAKGLPAIIRELQQAVTLESDPNWQSFLHGLIGMLLERSGEVDRALSSYVKALSFPDPREPSFDDVLKVYCQSSYYLGAIKFDRKDYDGTIDALFHSVPWMSEVFDDLFIGNILSFLSLSFLYVGNPSRALPFARAGAVIRECDEGSLGILQQVFSALAGGASGQ